MLGFLTFVEIIGMIVMTGANIANGFSYDISNPAIVCTGQIGGLMFLVGMIGSIVIRRNEKNK